MMTAFRDRPNSIVRLVSATGYSTISSRWLMLHDGQWPEPPCESRGSGAAVRLQETVDRFAHDVVLTYPRFACQLAKFEHLVII